ncbi:phosphatidylcholine transfer protein isoform X6 [Pongo pygmaeus]|uniref:phosphatidylcholine transfer protein isoform X6 n=1 Tax=Pongo pygmaeus TaxID=9600 RepID=UPI0023E176F9|nr:phosphatidylcholine transfer protein isoform X7 [Pongo pygmaeus]
MVRDVLASPLPSSMMKTGLYEYKVFGVLEDCSPTLLADIYMDSDYRKQWDQYVKELYEQECNGETVVYWEVKYPFPMSNRDYVYLRQRRDLDMEGRKIHVVLARSTSMPQLGERSGVIRVKQYKQSLAIESDGKKGSKVFMYYFDNPGGQIPSWLINWAAKAGLELLTSSNPLASVSQSAGITGISHYIRQSPILEHLFCPVS